MFKAREQFIPVDKQLALSYLDTLREKILEASRVEVSAVADVAVEVPQPGDTCVRKRCTGVRYMFHTIH